MKKIKLLIALISFCSIGIAQTQMPIGPQTGQFSSMVRGYHFVSPVAFNICALYIPPDAAGAAGQPQHIRVVRFNNAAPPAFPGVTNAFVQLFTITNAAANATVACNIPVAAGDIIGIYGARAGNCINSYDGANFNTNILGQPTTCSRSGMQACISGGQNMANIWSEVNFSIGRIFMYYNCCPTPTITTAASATNVCAGTNVTILGGGANTYTWMPGNINTQNITVTPTVTTTYTLSGDINTCIGVNTVTVQVNDYPTYTVSPLTSTICQNGSFTASVALANPTISSSYTWSPGPGIASPNASVTSITPSPITASIATAVYSVVVTPTAGYCPIEKTLTVTIVNPLTPTLTPAGPFCDSFSPVNLTAAPGGGTWSASPAVSANGLFTPSLAAIGSNTLVYSVGVGACVVTNSMVIDVSQFNTAAITSTLGTQCHSNPPVNLMGLVLSTINGTWTGTGVTSNSFNPTGLQTGVYTLTYNTTSSPNTTLCPDVQTFNISVLNPITPTITANHAYCDNMSPVQLTVTPANSGTWIATGYLNSTGVFTPSNALLGANTIEYVVGTMTCAATESISINVEKFIPATITNAAPDKCTTDPLMSLGGYVVNQTGTWSGPGVTGSQFDPATSGVGALTLTYTTHSLPTASLCPDNGVLAVNVFSLQAPVLGAVGPLCNTAPPVKINASPLGGIFYSYGSNALNYDGLFVPQNAFIGNNVITYSIASGPCLASAQITISIEKFVQASFVKIPGPFCKNDHPVNLYNYVQYLGGTFSGSGVTGNAGFDPSTANVGDNNYIVYSTHSIPTASLCPDSVGVRITINEVPNVTISSSTEEGCEPLPVLFNTPDVNTGTGEWIFGDGSPNQIGLNVVHTYTTPGSYNVLFTYSDDIGCKTTATLPGTVIVYEKPTALFSMDPSSDISMAKPEVNFINQSTVLGHNTYIWQIGNLYSLKEVNPRVVFPETGEYLITLTATSNKGCVADYSQKVFVKNDFGIYIPSAFTPNFDGLNDYFTPVLTTFGLDTKVYDLEIFDRWGHSLFRTKEYGVGWDGSKGNKGDEYVKEGVYIYKIKYKDMEGKIYHRTGHVTLMK